ncbi:MAG: hypothetical protein PVF45_10420 [Anaerolineae bacterium]|jgi:hypothetical protein
MKRRVLILISLLAVLLSGCVTLRIETRIKADGSGKKSFVMAFDKEAIAMIEEAGEGGDIWDQSRENITGSIKGAKIEDYSDDKSEGIKVTVPFANLAELEALSQSDVFQGADAVSVSQEGDTMTLRAVVNIGDITSGMDQSGGMGMEIAPGDFEMEYSYAVDVQGEILAYSHKDIAEIKGSKVTWNLINANAEQLELSVKWKPGSEPTNDMFTYLLIGIVVLGVVLIGAGVIMTLRPKQPQGPPGGRWETME